MDEILSKILASDILTDEVKKELAEAFKAELDKAKNEAREQAIVEVKAEYATEFVAAKEALVEALDTKVQEFLVQEMAELHDSIAAFRDLEAEKAAELVEEKAKLAKILESDMAELVENLDAFIEQRLNEEFIELKESIEEVKKNEFGRAIYESFSNEYSKNFFDKDQASKKLVETEKQLKEATEQLSEVSKKLNSVNRAKELNKVLENLQGRPREIMEAILKNSPTDKLEETYSNFIGRVLHESAKTDEQTVDATQKETANTAVLAEGNNTGVKDATVVVSGDKPINENHEDVPAKSNPELDRIKRLAGLSTR